MSPNPPSRIISPSCARRVWSISAKKASKRFYTLNQERIAVCCGQIMLKFAPEEKATEAVIKVVNR